MKSDIEESNLVSLASIAAVLYGVKSVAWGVSLAAKNAKVISAQAGNKGLGFQPITDFIDEISQLAMEGVNEISDDAIRLLKIAVNEQRSYDAYRRFATVKEKYKDAKYIESISNTIDGITQHMFVLEEKFRKSKNQLVILLSSMNRHMLSARSIASVSRIVTSDAQEYRAKLELVADDLDEAANYISEKISNSYHYLDRVRVQARKTV